MKRDYAALTLALLAIDTSALHLDQDVSQILGQLLPSDTVASANRHAQVASHAKAQGDSEEVTYLTEEDIADLRATVETLSDLRATVETLSALVSNQEEHLDATAFFWPAYVEMSEHEIYCFDQEQVYEN